MQRQTAAHLKVDAKIVNDGEVIYESSNNGNMV